MSEQPGASGALDAAIQRLDRAVVQLERRIGVLAAEAEGSNGGLFEQDRANLAVELDAARGRERQLEAAGKQASVALGRAIAGIRAALGDDEAEGEAGAEAEIHDAAGGEA
jgi:hypothetical protein